MLNRRTTSGLQGYNTVVQATYQLVSQHTGLQAYTSIKQFFLILSYLQSVVFIPERLHSLSSMERNIWS
jgi:hypothetical protein